MKMKGDKSLLQHHFSLPADVGLQIHLSEDDAGEDSSDYLEEDEGDCSQKGGRWGAVLDHGLELEGSDNGRVDVVSAVGHPD